MFCIGFVLYVVLHFLCDTMCAKNTLLPVQSLLKSGGKLLEISKPIVMGILNATPDSFYNRGRHSSTDALLQTAGKMLHEGATILDIGGASTRQGALRISAAEECDRILPLLQSLHHQYPDAWLSVDTYNAETAAMAVAEGVSIVNDISGGQMDTSMLETVAALGVPYIGMHLQGTPETMQQDPHYIDVVAEVRDSLRLLCDRCEAAGIADVIIDPGFGFGKTHTHNFQLLNGMHTLRLLGKPILAGISRKSMVWRTLDTTPDEALNGTTALHMIALQQGASILRVHDVKEAVETIRLWEMMEAARGDSD